MVVGIAQTDPAEHAALANLHYTSSDEPGIARKRSGSGFAYFLPEGRRVRDEATLARIRSLAIPPAWRDVWISTDPDGHLQAVGRDARGRKQYRHHPRWRSVRDEASTPDRTDRSAPPPCAPATLACAAPSWSSATAAKGRGGAACIGARSKVGGDQRLRRAGLERGARGDDQGNKATVTRVVEAVAAQLGNTPAVCRKCYIHPLVIDGFMDGRLADGLGAAVRRLGRELRDASRSSGALDSALLTRVESAVVGFLEKPARKVSFRTSNQIERDDPVGPRVRACARPSGRRKMKNWAA